MKKNINIFILTIFILSNLVTSPIYAYERCSTLRPLNAAVSAAADVLASLSTEEPSIQRDRFDIANYEPINPFLINMLNRFKRTQDILELNGDTFRKLVNPYQIFKGAVFAETAGKHRQALSYRIKHNVVLGPGGGGMRYITTSELPSDNVHFIRNPDYPIELELVGVNSMQEAEVFVDR